MLCLVCYTAIVSLEQNHSTVTQAERYAKTVVRALPGGWEAFREALVYSSKPQPESGQGLLSDRERQEAKISLTMMQMLFKWLGSNLSGSWFIWFRLPVCMCVCMHRICQRQVRVSICHLTVSLGKSVSVNAEACQRQVPVLPSMPAVQQLEEECKAQGQVLAIVRHRQLNSLTLGDRMGSAHWCHVTLV